MVAGGGLARGLINPFLPHLPLPPCSPLLPAWKANMGNLWKKVARESQRPAPLALILHHRGSISDKFIDSGKKTKARKQNKKTGREEKKTGQKSTLHWLYWLGLVYFHPGISKTYTFFGSNYLSHVFVERNWWKKAVYKSQQQAPFIDPTQLGQTCPPNRGLSSQKIHS